MIFHRPIRLCNLDYMTVWAFLYDTKKSEIPWPADWQILYTTIFYVDLYFLIDFTEVFVCEVVWWKTESYKYAFFRTMQNHNKSAYIEFNSLQW